jgi:zinc transport system ATP-binding protein
MTDSIKEKNIQNKDECKQSDVDKTLISASNISLKDGNKTLLHDISLSIYAGEIITIIGPNGAGKTTLLNILLGLRKASSGEVKRINNLRIGYMPQRLQLNPQLPLTVERFLALVNVASPSTTNTKDSTLPTIDSALKRTGVAHLKQSDMNNLSGGEIQRVLLSRALLREPQLLVLDEPVQGVDIGGQNQLYQLINELRNELNCGVLMVSHDLHLVMAATDHVICLNQHICCHGHPESVSNHPAYLELFGHAATNLATYTHHHDHDHDLHGEVLNCTEPNHSDCHHSNE